MTRVRDARELIAWLIAQGYITAEEAEFALVCRMQEGLSDD